MAKRDDAIIEEVADMFNRRFAPNLVREKAWQNQYKPGDRVEILAGLDAVTDEGVIKNAWHDGYVVITSQGRETYVAYELLRPEKSTR